MKNIYNIPIENFNAFKKRIDQLNKKALKLNLEPIKLKILDTFVYDNEVSLDIPCYKIEITQNNQIRVNGYEFVGKLEKNINNTLKKENSQTTFRINYGMNYFPEKEYKNVIYKEGNYESLVVEIGEAKGENWWCVLFPPLCSIDVKKEDKDFVEYKSKVLEILNHYN